MAITGGFGMTMDIKHGTTRRWVMGRDGVKRWADTNESVEDQRKFRGSGELERAGYIPAGSADEREGVTPNDGLSGRNEAQRSDGRA